MGYIILSDSTTGLSKEMAAECDVKIIPLSFIMKGEEYSGTSQEDIKMFYEELRKKENASTSCMNVEGFKEIFREELSKGQDILYLAFSSGLSSTYNNSVTAAEEMKKEFPNQKILCVDTLAASLGEGYIVYHAGMLRKEGKSLTEVYEWAMEWRYKTSHLFTVDDLFFLYRGGRVKPTSYLMANVLNVKPLMHVPNDGSLQAYGKVIGRKKSIAKLVERFVETVENPEEQTIFIGHGDCMEDVELCMKLINEKVKVKGFRYNFIDPVIGVHSGPGTFAIFYFSKERA